MANYSIWMLEESNITVTGGVSLDGITQGDGSHLVGNFITLNTNDWLEVNIRDSGSDNFFDDNDGNQSLAGRQTINGQSYRGNTDVEAEYIIVLRDPNTGLEYTAVGFNVNDSAPAYSTVEGLTFVGGANGFPPVGTALEVVSAREGPGSFGQDPIVADDYAFPICFTPGTQVQVPDGVMAIENLATGDMVLTRDNGYQPVRWVGHSYVSPKLLADAPQFTPVRITRNALGQDRPNREMLVSQQHRLLLTGWQAELMFGEPEVLAAARHLVNGSTIDFAFDVDEVEYLHVLFDSHEVIFADGIEAESFRPGPASLAALGEATRAELIALFPELADSGDLAVDPAHKLLRSWESKLMAG